MTVNDFNEIERLSGELAAAIERIRDAETNAVLYAEDVTYLRGWQDFAAEQATAIVTQEQWELPF